MSSAPPPAVVYLAPGFEPMSLKASRASILLEHDVRHSALAKKADLIGLFNVHVVPRAAAILASHSNIQPSAQGVIAVANDGTESLVEEPVKKRGPGRPRKFTRTNSATLVPAAMPAPRISDASIGDIIEVGPLKESSPPTSAVESKPDKKSRGRPRMSAFPAAPPIPAPIEDALELLDAAESEPITAPVKKPRGRPRQTVIVEVPPPAPPAVSLLAQPSVDLHSLPKRGRKGKAKVDELAEADDEADLLASPRKAQRVALRRSLATASSTSVTHTSDAPDSSSPAPSTAPPHIRFHDLPDEAEVEAAEIARQERKARRESKLATHSGDESGFSDANPFQAGSAKAAKIERRRSSLGVTKPKRAPRASDLAFAATSSTQSPASILRRVGPSSEDLRAPPAEVRDSLRREYQLDEAEEHNALVSSKLNQLSSRDVQPLVQVAEQQLTSNNTATLSPGRRAVRPTYIWPLLLALLFSPILSNYKSQSSAIGFCDTQSTTNDIVTHREAAIRAAESCAAKAAEHRLEHPDAPPIHCDVSDLPLVPFLPRPTACAPCPPHAQCIDGKIVACEPEYLLAPHPLAGLSPVLDGIPGLGSKAFPPSCEPDTARKLLLGQLVRELESHLARKRGEAVCAGVDEKHADGRRLGARTAQLREEFAARRDPAYSRDDFDTLFAAALDDLLAHGDIFNAVAVDGEEWVASARTDMTLACRAKREALGVANRWKTELGGTLAILAAIAALSSKQNASAKEKYEARELVEVVLRRLQDQERLHYTDPVTAPHPFLPPAQLRDLVMPHSAATSGKDRLWRRVAESVGKNANVIVREQEVNGDTWETWTWTGPRAYIE
ncbi:inner nuclear membrane protein enriched at telomere/subtelomere region [Cryptotrichosporon argae]